MRILALQLKRLGDVVLTTPALARLSREGEVTLGVMGAASELLPLIPNLAGAIVFGPGRGWTPWQQVIWGRFDRVVDFTGTDRSALVALLSRAPRRITFQRAKSSWVRRRAYHELIESLVREQHTIEHYAELVSPGGEGVEAQPRLEMRPAAREQARALRAAHGIAGDYVLIHPGTARLEKFWRPERWAEVILHIERQLGLRCVLTGGFGAEEKVHLAAIAGALPAPPVDLSGKLDLLGLAAMVSDARLVLSVDTVVVHLAAAFQRPQVALFGPTNPFHWRPRHPQAAVFSAARPEAPLTTFEPRMKGAPMEHLSTAPVIHATEGLLLQSALSVPPQ